MQSAHTHMQDLAWSAPRHRPRRHRFFPFACLLFVIFCLFYLYFFFVHFIKRFIENANKAKLHVFRIVRRTYLIMRKKTVFTLKMQSENPRIFRDYLFKIV